MTHHSRLSLICVRQLSWFSSLVLLGVIYPYFVSEFSQLSVLHNERNFLRLYP